MATVFASYATSDFNQYRDALCSSAQNVGFDQVLRLSPEDLSAEFHQQNADILSHKRGGGFWLWKPKIILDTLRSLAPGDLLVYSDAGRSKYYQFSAYPHKLSARVLASEDGFLLGPSLVQHGPLMWWTKRDCLKVMNMDRPEVLVHPLIQATWSFWTPTPAAFAFLEEWLYYCKNPRCLTDIPNLASIQNYQGFVDHRHDQSVLTLLALKRGAPFLNFSSTGVFKILSLRPQSKIAHMFLKRIDDAERLESGQLIKPLVSSFIDLME